MSPYSSTEEPIQGVENLIKENYRIENVVTWSKNTK